MKKKISKVIHIEYLMDSDNDLDEERKMEIEFQKSGKNISSDITESASKNLNTHIALKGIIGNFEKSWTFQLTKGSKDFT